MPRSVRRFVEQRRSRLRMYFRRERRVAVAIFLALLLAVACARLGLGLPPLSLDDYTPHESRVLAFLAASPVLFMLAGALIGEKWLRGVPQWILMAASVGGLLTYIAMSPTNFGSEPQVMEALRACPIAVEQLGDRPRRRMLGVQESMSWRKRARTPERTFEMLAEGSRGSGVIAVTSQRTDKTGDAGEKHAILRAELTAGSRIIDLLTCGSAAP